MVTTPAPVAPGRVWLKPGHVRPVFSGHPWVFKQAIARVEGGAQPGDEVVVLDPHGAELGRGLYAPKSAIAVRMFTRDPAVPIDGELIRSRMQKALELRAALDLPTRAPGRETTAFRLVHGEGDRLPGLIVDLFDDVAIVQLNTIGLQRLAGAVVDALGQTVRPRAIVERTSATAARADGFEPPAGGLLRGDADVTILTFVERGFSYTIPFELTQKTGFYFDQRLLRARIEKLARGRTVLDAYCYVGSFSLAAARGGAERVVAVDESALALEVAATVARQNGQHGVIEHIRADARKMLAKAGPNERFDLVILDPPKLAPKRGARDGALGAYRALAAAGCRATTDGGTLVVCSCSAAVSMDDLVRALAWGAADARAHATVVERHFQGADHPVPAAFPEGLYLKSLIARVEGWRR